MALPTLQPIWRSIFPFTNSSQSFLCQNSSFWGGWGWLHLFKMNHYTYSHIVLCYYIGGASLLSAVLKEALQVMLLEVNVLNISTNVYITFWFEHLVRVSDPLLKMTHCQRSCTLHCRKVCLNWLNETQTLALCHSFHWFLHVAFPFSKYISFVHM